MTPRQSELLTFIRDFIDENDHSPSYEEMQARLGLASKSGVHRLVVGLEEAGYLRRPPHRARALEVTLKGSTGGKPSLDARLHLAKRIADALFKAHGDESMAPDDVPLAIMTRADAEKIILAALA